MRSGLVVLDGETRPSVSKPYIFVSTGPPPAHDTRMSVPYIGAQSKGFGTPKIALWVHFFGAQVMNRCLRIMGKNSTSGRSCKGQISSVDIAALRSDV